MNMQLAKKRRPLKIFLLVTAMIVVLAGLAVAGFFVYDKITNTYEKPVNIKEKQLNSKRFVTQYDKYRQNLNGFAVEEYDRAVNILEQADGYAQKLEAAKEEFQKELAEDEASYGKNFKHRVRIAEAKELKEEELETYRNELTAICKYINEYIQLSETWEETAWEEAAAARGISSAQLAQLMEAGKAITAKLEKAEVSAGYQLSLEYDYGDDGNWFPGFSPYMVYQVDGRWIWGDVVYIFAHMLRP